MARLRAELNAYVTALHRVHPNGATVFRATAELVRRRDVTPVDLHWPGPDALDAGGLRTARELVEQVEVAARGCGSLAGHPWAAARRADWSPAWERDVSAALTTLDQAAGRVEAALGRAAGLLGAPAGDRSLADLDALDEVASVLLGEARPPAALLVRPAWPEIERELSSWIGEGRRRDAMRERLYATFQPAILQLDLDGLDRRLRRASGAWAPLAWLRRWPVRRALRRVRRVEATGPSAEAPEALAATVTAARALRTQEALVASAGEAARALLGEHWRDGEPAWPGLEGLRDAAARLRALAGRLTSEAAGAARLLDGWATLALGPAGGPGSGGEARETLEAFRDALARLTAGRREAARVLELVPTAWGDVPAPDALARLRATSEAWRRALPALRTWCAWRRVRAAAAAAGLGPLVEALEAGRVEPATAGPVFERSYWGWWLGEVVEREPALRTFSSPEHERRIARFQEADRAHTELTGRLVAARLAQRVPRVESAPASSELGVLQREITKRTRHLPVRQLLQRIPNLLPRLTPCVLMSPMSVAQYLDAAFPPFDVVVFDEASQIPVWDAVGAIARGRQTVIVGDPRQLPPTTFFQRADEADATAPGEDSTDQVEDLESILDDCLAARVPALRLQWHYRSRHESLIAFSNARYYENRLLTFPSPLREGMGVAWRPVPDGVYDRSRSRTNRREAEAVVAEIVTRLRERLARPEGEGPSLGVVTFNLAQQGLVEDLLDEARRDDPALEPFFAEEAVEPVFVKNLESVQGDERDVILFSVTYGPDESGQVSMNFGPLNQEGGERRLNVAITRARREVLVFSTLRAEQVDLARTAARGAGDLKAFLEYAERGVAALATGQAAGLEEGESAIEAAVHEALVARGWTVHRQVGCSGYRIDLAVVDPERPDRYLVGVECDGANYQRAATARDRDRLRADVLQDLGWTLHRVWSSDWWADPAREVERIEAALRRAGQAPDTAGRAGQADPPPGGVGGPAPEAPRLAAGLPAAPTPVESPAGAPGPASPAPAGSPGPAAPLRYRLYRAAGLDRLGRTLFEPGGAARLGQELEALVATEGPVHLDLAARRLAEAAGVGRTTAPLVASVRQAASRAAEVRMTTGTAGVFLWPRGLAPETYRDYRVPGDDAEATRDAEDLPPEEVANAALAVVEAGLSVPAEDLARETSRLLGFQRLGRVVEERMALGISVLLASGRAAAEDGRIRLRR